MNWIKKHKSVAIKALQFNEKLCIKLEDLCVIISYTKSICPENTFL